MSDKRLIKAFWKFHNENPHVYQRLVELVNQLRIKGHTRYSMKGLFEILRWEYAITTTGNEFKLSNDFTAFYARLVMRRQPLLKGFFDIKTSAADNMFTPIRTPV